MFENRILALAGAVFVITTSTIAGAWGFEIIGGYEPCALCLQQRLPYYATIPISAIAVILAWNNDNKTLLVWLMIICAGLMAFSAGFGLYHAGIEWHWWLGPAKCSSPGAFNATTSFLPDLSKRPVLCTEAALRIFGISLAGYNALISAGLMLLSLKAVFLLKKRGP